MRHNKHSHTLGVKKEHRAALIANLASSLIIHGRIETTLAKAKALRPFVEKVITLARKGTLHHRRQALSKLRSQEAVAILFNEKAEEFRDRPGGYTRIYKLGRHRLGDAAEMALIELIPASDEGYRKSRRKGGAAKKAAAAAPVAEKEETPAESEESAEPEATAEAEAEAKESSSEEDSGEEQKD